MSTEDLPSAKRRGPITRASRGAALLGASLLLLALGGCGESKEEKAEKTVCAARTEIKSELEHLSTLTPSTSSLNELKEGATKIEASLKKMTEAEKELSPARKEEVKHATEEFQKSIEEAISGVTKGTSSASQALAAVTTALDTVKAAYTQALAPIKCS
ncbi:MAG TPA: hypothetical protein VKG82_00050 [Solirubrobacteraceae bacterium]|nr:hypothetical protein [Solirubrobacteraceae bacterium]